MTPERLVLDTDIVIHLLKKQPAIVERFLVLLEAKTEFLISPIVVAEIYACAFTREHKDVEAFFTLVLANRDRQRQRHRTRRWPVRPSIPQCFSGRFA